MIAEPINDRACLDAITAVIAELVANDDPTVAELATKYPTRRALVAWLRSLPQRDDEGLPEDGPKVDACRPPQRLRIAPPDPNCVERAAIFVAVAERLDPRPTRRLATVDTPSGPHTFPVEDGEPVVLDPAVTRNALRGGLFRNAPAPVRMTPAEAIDWVVDLASEPASRFAHGHRLVELVRAAMHAVLRGERLASDVIEDVALVLALAEREARAFGPRGVMIVHVVAEALAELDAAAWRNSLRIGGYRIRPHPVVSGVARAGGRIGQRVAGSALRVYLASLGVPPQLVDELERELNREGLTLGLLGRPGHGAIETLAEQEVKRRAA